MIFEFVVHRLRWLRRVPCAPQIFDAWLLTSTALFDRRKLSAMMALEAQVLQWPGVRLCVHRFGGTGFMRASREFGHIHGNGLLDVHLTLESAGELVASGSALRHHVLGASPWISFWVRRLDDVSPALALLKRGADLATAQEGRPTTRDRRNQQGDQNSVNNDRPGTIRPV